MALNLNILSLALLGAAAVAFTRQRRHVLAVCGGLFVPVAAWATVAVWWPVSPVLGMVLLAGTMGVALAGVALYALDRAAACFAVEMTYATVPCWLLWPVLVMANFVGLLLA